jgi:hypothetical protein
MATITSAASGNWSAGATWVGSVAPGVNDDAVIGAGHTVTLDVDATVLTLSGAANTTSNLAITTSRNFTCTGANGITAKSINAGLGLVRIATAGITVNINSVLRGSVNSGTNAVSINSNCIVNIVGNVLNQAGSSGGNTTLSIAGGATVYITGDLISNVGNSGATTALTVDGGATVNITGNVDAASTSTVNPSAIRNVTSACTINITGNVTAGVATALTSTQNSTITVVGTITANTNNMAISMTSGNITISTPCLNATNGVMAVFAPNVKIYNAIASWRFATDIPATNKFLYSAGVALGNPVIGDVRDGTVYGASNELTGSLIMAVPSDVRKSVPTDATVGTADLTAQDIFTEIASSSDPIAVRLRNIATVQTTGAQLASYN